VTRARSDMLRRRLTPLYAAAFLQNLALWVPIAKLFMTTIGFNAASVGAMAAVYAVVVPPSSHRHDAVLRLAQASVWKKSA
jgi:hypothetical protein